MTGWIGALGKSVDMAREKLKAIDLEKVGNYYFVALMQREREKKYIQSRM